MRHQRGGADGQHLRNRDHDERQVSREADGGDRIRAEPAHPEKIDQYIERLEDHAHEHEARGFQEMVCQGAGREVLHTAV